MRNNKGFTLIELLTVVAIIGILASIVLVGLGGFRARGRDSRRIADLRQIQNALELYYLKNGSYPMPAGFANMSAELTSAGIGVDRIPNDPSTGKSYGYASNGQTYMLQTQLEGDNNALNDDYDDIPAATPTIDNPDGFSCDDAAFNYCVKF